MNTSRIVIAGGTGFLGAPLAGSLEADGHEVVVLSRRASKSPSGRRRVVAWNPDGTAPASLIEAVNGAAAVINLAGESIAGRRWSKAHKARIMDSRVLATRSLAGAIAAASVPPAVFVSGSAVGYYGPRGDEEIAEDAGPGNDFLARVCVAWETEADRASASTRVVAVRTGIVLARDGGALPQMLPPFWFGAGGPVGSGRQYWPWIHRDDWIGLVRFTVATPSASGPMNATAPEPVTNAEFARALGRALRRPVFLPAPGFALKLLLGEMAGPLLLTGQRAVPSRAEALGYSFAFRQVDMALRDLFR